MNLSVVILTYNSTRTIRKVLEAVAGWANEIVIVDSGSTDGTLEIAKEFGCNVFYKAFNGFGNQKRFAVEQAINDWVFVVDSDEVVTQELKNEIDASLESNNGYQGFKVPRILIFLGKELKYGRESKLPTLRIFNKRYGNYNTNDVHEDVVLDGKTLTLKNSMLHYSFSDVAEFFQKMNDYSSRSAFELYKKGKRASTLKVVTKFPVSFFVEYFIRLNFLNGYAGLVWSLTQAVYASLKYIKLKELQSRPSFSN
ncbi:glycosyltransferase family 2 protein [Emticicia sp. 21SJ11W-3]|uniref:glycosyltransferase family 2 protein n=1 Tax=Emticicia sp. 21SJ11W-3 TaxID=2916755 RepID=UPI00209FFFF2|nr:glycosyltransferase family 2 protein [Emticicia sp. 21SJ11W-3]UTA69405.1 glycosyltransferase family 2 protein [Emticicia sp. 21SJ11W-3]